MYLYRDREVASTYDDSSIRVEQLRILLLKTPVIGSEETGSHPKLEFRVQQKRDSSEKLVGRFRFP
jgi:hypothetical protein